MAKKRNGLSKSAAIRDFLRANRKKTAKEVVAALAEKGIQVTEGLVYYTKGKMRGRRGRRKKARLLMANVAATGNRDPVATILLVKSWASQVGGMKKLKALVDALAE